MKGRFVSQLRQSLSPPPTGSASIRAGRKNYHAERTLRFSYLFATRGEKRGKAPKFQDLPFITSALGPESGSGRPARFPPPGSGQPP